MVISILAVIVWYGFNRQPGGQETAVRKSSPYTEPVEYTKCTTTDGEVIFGEPPAGTKCKEFENIRSEITIAPSSKPVTGSAVGEPSLAAGKFRCDGRQHCSQMTSRAEAEFFLKNCPNMKMDGDRDGIPCENDSRF